MRRRLNARMPKGRAAPGLMLALCVFGFAANARAADGLSLGMGLDYSAGRYGGASQTRVLASLLQARYDTGPYSLRLYLPYLRLSGPASVLGFGDSIQLLPEAGKQQRRVEGPGDAVLGGSYMLYHAPETGDALDLGGKIKFPTADSAKGLGSGKTDYSLQATAYRRRDRATLMLGLGYKWLGKPAGSDYRNTANASAGLDYRYSDRLSLGGMVDVQQSALAGQAGRGEVTFYAAYKLDRQWTGQAYVYKGTTSSSPDGGGGLSLNHRF